MRSEKQEQPQQLQMAAVNLHADGRRAVGRVEVGDLVNQAVFLAALEYLVALLAVDLAAVAGADVVLRALVEEDAYVLLQVAAALAHQAAGTAAGAVGDGDSPGVVDYLVYLLIAAPVRVVLYGHLNRDDAHHALADGDERSQRGDAPARVLLKALGYDGVTLAQLLVADHHLHDARHPDGQEILVLAVLEVAAADAYLRQLVEHLFYTAKRLFDLLRHLLGADVLAHLQPHGDLSHLVGHDRLKYLVLGVVRRDTRVGAALDADLRSQLQYACSHSQSPSFEIL